MSNEDFAVDPTEATDEEISRGLELLAKEKLRKHKIETGQIKGEPKWADMTEEQKDKARYQGKRYNARIKLMVDKAKEAGIEVTDDEVDFYIEARV